MINKRILLFSNALSVLFLLCCNQVAIGQELVKTEGKPSEGELKNEYNKEEAARERDESAADRDVRKALKAFQENHYAEAVDLYNAAILKLKKSSELSKHVEDKIKNIRQNMAVVYHYWARAIAEQAEKDIEANKFEDAMEKCNKAVKMDPSLKKRMELLIKRFQKKEEVATYKSETSEKVVDGAKEKRLYQIDILMAQGRKLYDENLLHRAREKFEGVLVLDPYNLAAIEMIRKLNQKIYDAGAAREEMTIKERDAEVVWGNVTPLMPRSLEPDSRAPEPIKKNIAGTKIQKKLEDIMIEHMEFEDASIPAVVNMLRIEAKKKDKDKEGVNILLRLADTTPGASSDSDLGTSEDSGDSGDEFLLDDTDSSADEDLLSDDSALDDTGDLGDSETPGGSGGGGRTVTIMFDDLSLGDAIRNICLAADLKYRIEEYAVVIAGKDVPLDELETRIYPIDNEAGMNTETDTGAGGDTGGGTASVQDYFEKQGVLFPEGSKIVYDESISRLIATNTPEQLRRIERIIDELNVIDPQVLIECKFVEFKENKANEFGIAWTYERPDQTSDRSVTFEKNDQPLRFLNQTDTNPPLLNGHDTAFAISNTKHGVTTSATVHALDLEDNANILSCPRITTQNGEEATIRMVTEEYFPDTWGEPTLLDTGDGGAVGYVSSMPEFSEPTELGVRLTVTPTVDPDKYTITLDMIPVVQSQVDWTDYSYVQQTSIGTVKNVVRMVIIEARTITTQLTIYDGETVVMGGIMRDNIEKTDDRWPILGDLPVVGRFFRSKTKVATKENLLIFTTPRLVNPNGSPLRQREVRGKPPFRM